ncbi:HTH_Tnp_Tc3_2 domain-containing protein [Trichonephila clavipes]|uniref:HTH_Tnp_Tc3_2 domain-containing protein n=1 Tax=Trichonephila clavipes TaxID=2585209 RepID=A0A8X6S8X3_TRICX|nr:HTH_Tnp_Tc3_2 domain-containing protein [Trichonephila clavipes]
MHYRRSGTTDQRGQSHASQNANSREDRQIVRITVTDLSVTSRTVPQHIVSVTHHSVSARTIRCRLQQSVLSTRRPLLGLPLTQRHMWSMVAQRLTQITPPTASPEQLWQRVEAAWSAVPLEHIQSIFESMPRRVATVISNNGGYSGY